MLVCAPAMTRINFKQFFWGLLSREAASFQGSNLSVLNGHLGTEPLQLLRQGLVIGARRLVLRTEFDGRAEIGQRPGPVAFPAPEFASGVEDVGQRRVKPQRRVVVADGAVELVLAVVCAGARDQRLD